MKVVDQDFQKVIAILKYLNLELPDPKNNANFQTRLFIQKIIFLSKFMGIKLKRYNFGLYKNGPYSPDLTADYYDNNELILTLDTEVELTSDEIRVVDKINNTVLKHDLCMNHQSDFLEAVSTAYYIKHYNQNDPPEVIFRKTKEEKPFISEKIVVIAMNLLTQLIHK